MARMCRKFHDHSCSTGSDIAMLKRGPRGAARAAKSLRWSV